MVLRNPFRSEIVETPDEDPRDGPQIGDTKTESKAYSERYDYYDVFIKFLDGRNVTDEDAGWHRGVDWYEVDDNKLHICDRSVEPFYLMDSFSTNVGFDGTYSITKGFPIRNLKKYAFRQVGCIEYTVEYEETFEFKEDKFGNIKWKSVDIDLGEVSSKRLPGEKE